jgi:hypothetical protein
LDLNDVEDDELPEDIGTSDRDVSIPHKNDLDLGRRLALAFVARALPDDYEMARQFFQRRGAYSRFKDLLNRRSVLEAWHHFEEQATNEALRRRDPGNTKASACRPLTAGRSTRAM